MSKKQKNKELVMKIKNPSRLNHKGIEVILSQADRSNKSVHIHSALKDKMSEKNMKDYGHRMIFEDVLMFEKGGFYIVLANSAVIAENQQTLNPYQNL